MSMDPSVANGHGSELEKVTYCGTKGCLLQEFHPGTCVVPGCDSAFRFLRGVGRSSNAKPASNPLPPKKKYLEQTAQKEQLKKKKRRAGRTSSAKKKTKRERGEDTVVVLDGVPVYVPPRQGPPVSDLFDLWLSSGHQIGDEVWAHWGVNEVELWWKGRVSNVNHDGTVDVVYEDGDFEANKTPHRVRCHRRAPLPSSSNVPKSFNMNSDSESDDGVEDPEE